MKYLLLLLITIGFAFSVKPPETGRGIFTKIYERYSGKWYKTFSFTQTTEMYRNDSLRKTEIWYEHIQFPQNFRIDFGDADSGNAVIFTNDSSYVFRNGRKIRGGYYPNDLLFLLGGMYFYPLDESIKKLGSFGFDINKFHEDEWKGDKVYVIGAEKKEDSVNQVWFDKKNYNLVRMIKFDKGQKEEAFPGNHVKLNGGYSETLVHFYINDKLVQVEKYYNLKGDIKIDPAIFDSGNFIKRKNK